MTDTTVSRPLSKLRRFPKPRRLEVAFLAFSAGVFSLGIAAYGTVCIVCAHPATVVAAGG